MIVFKNSSHMKCEHILRTEKFSRAKGFSCRGELESADPLDKILRRSARKGKRAKAEQSEAGRSIRNLY